MKINNSFNSRISFNFVGKNISSKKETGVVFKSKADFFSYNIDKTLNPAFLNQLKSIPLDGIERFNEIKNMLLRQMGYSNPEIVKTVPSPLEEVASFNPANCKIFVNDKIAYLPIVEQIAVLRHELDHLDKFVKMYKALGEEEFSKTIRGFMPENLQQEKAFKRYFASKTYQKMSNDVSLEGFDVQKYYNALKNYSLDDDTLFDRRKYYDNPLEESAYAIESKIRAKLGTSSITSRDMYLNNLEYLHESLSKNGIPTVLQRDEIITRAKEMATFAFYDSKNIQILKKLDSNGILDEDESENFFNFPDYMYSVAMMGDLKLQNAILKANLELEKMFDSGVCNFQGIVKYLSCV